MHKRWVSTSPRERVVASLAGLTGVSTLLFVAGAIADHSTAFSFMLYNLFLAWLPFVAALLLVRGLRTRLWSSWPMLLLTLLWLLLLPNSFYMISDFTHLGDMVHRNLLYDTVLFAACIFTAVLVGYCSLYMVHAQLRKRLSGRASASLIAVVLLLGSFAIYLGRNLRWNSWDVLLNPAGILFDVSDVLIHPLQHGAALSTTVSFFVLLGSLYVVGWQLGEATRQQSTR